MSNERITENLVRDYLRKFDYYSPDNDIRVEEQKSEIQSVKKLLKGASKSGKGGIGSPEFIISSVKAPDFLVVIECKAKVQDHESPNRDEPVKYAVDGTLHYAEKLSKEYNVIAVAVSGQTDASLKVSTFIHTKGGDSPKELITKANRPIKQIIPWNDYIEHGTFDPDVQRMRFNELMAFSRTLHEFMRDHAKLTENEKPLLVSGTLIALYNSAFAKSFDEYDPEQLQRQWLHFITEEINKANIPNSKRNNMTQPYSSIAVHPELGKATKAYPKGVLHELIKMLNEKVWPFISVYHDFDVVGQFYGEFLKYTGGDKKALGIVLTPRHISELFTLIANLKKDSRVLDFCCGTGGFLVSSMNAMMKLAITEAEKEKIKSGCLVGVEQQPSMYALAASNMILRGDGKANLYQGSCFEPAIVKALKVHNCDVGMINPPYSQSDEDLHELVFVRDMLNCLVKGGTGVAIVPITCATSPHIIREEILKHHTLEAVMSMPGELFYPVGTVTCIMVFTAHVPHEDSNKKTWFGYWRNDGFVKTKHRGRIDLKETWPSIRDSWVEAFRNRDEIPGLAVKRQVDQNDEWCAEAYLETDYSTLSAKDFEDEVKKYVVYRMINEIDVTTVDEEGMEDEDTE
ncbi:HsdM family class I SAM-dependent methyltransferase [Shouchella lonarensis]|uniref:site-specific DNA-methyltransferase (adenine-specific) n=1 Tax=Shouchella lonarensis TaxID=1464122 RepID=A0A1G6GKZ9_9BACI|nr:N-6 DNA methylase [Shouchella lonarensis]SDB81836.1 N-6 DNA Methylase [Shouchella lonarensis]